MKHIFKSIFALSIAGILFACNNDSGKDVSSTTTSDTSATAGSTTTDPAPTGPTLPFDIFNIYHTVKDYNVWRAAFDADSGARIANGLNTIAVERAVAKPNDIKIVFGAADLAKARSFAGDTRLKDVMGKAGVTSKPDMQYWKVVRFNPENVKPGSTRLQIVHKVKDFDEWIKGFEAEGATTRAANGMADIAVARGIDDTNLVHIAFDVTDMAKAKARLADPALKKIMTDAGVIGSPTILFYSDVTK